MTMVFLGKVVGNPLRSVFRLLKGLVVGCFVLLVLDGLGAAIHLHIPLNLFTLLVAGILGLPGIAALLVLQLWIMP